MRKKCVTDAETAMYCGCSMYTFYLDTTFA